MADPMTQPQLIPSSQGLNDGHSKESKSSDSFFSSSPVSLIQSSQEKRVALDSEKPSDGVPTTLRFSTQPSSFSPATYGTDNVISSTGIKDRSFQEKRELFESSIGSQKQDSSPIKISPVSERIRALEALAAKQNESDWSDTGFSHFRDRHYDKSSSEVHGITLRSSVKKKPASSEQDSPESPFEILGDSRRGSDFEDTADWMRAHLPPAPNFNIGESDFDEVKESVIPECVSDETRNKGTEVQGIPPSFVGVPDEFMDNPDEEAKQMNEDSNQSKQDAVENESEFDLRFLPTAYMWDKQDKPDMDTQQPPLLSENREENITISSVLPLGFEEPLTSIASPASVPQTDCSGKQQAATRSVGSAGVDILEVDSSGESDDTVIEDANGIGISDVVACGVSTDKQPVPNKQEKQSIQVPIINVIETEEQVLSDYEVDPEEEDEQKYEIIQETVTEPPQPSKELSDISRSEFDETAPKTDVFSQKTIADSDEEYSPKHKIINEISNDSIDQTSSPAKSPSLEDSCRPTVVPQATNETPRASSFNKVQSDKVTEIVPDLPPNYEDLINDFESSDIDTYLDHYSSEELALKDQLNSGVFTANNGKTNELQKSNSLQDIKSNSALAQQTFEETPDAFDETVDVRNQIYDTEPEPFSANISADIAVEPLFYQNNMDLVLDDQSVDKDDKKAAMDSERFSLNEEDYHMIKDEVQLPSCQEGTPAQFPSFHSEPSIEISNVFPDFVSDDVTEELLVTDIDQGEIIQYADLDKPISSEITNKSESTETKSQKREIILNAPEIQISEAPTIIPEPSDTESEHDEIGTQGNDSDAPISSEIPSKLESTGEEFSPAAATDSFVEFMRECLKSQQDEESQSPSLVQTTEEAVSAGPSSPVAIMDFEQECLTICALKELGSGYEGNDDGSIPKDIPAAASDALSQPLFQSESLICSDSSSHHLPNKNQPDASLTKEIEAIDIWVAEAYHLAEHVLALILTHLSVHDLVYWRDPKKSGVVFGISLLLLLSLAAFSVISVVSYLLLALLCVTISFRVYKSVIQAVQKSSDGHPFKELMEKDVTVPPESFRKHTDACLTYINRALKQLSRLFLVEDLVDSLKLAVFMWLLTYVGAVFNGITILILVDILAFTVPPLYEKYKTQIDHYIEIIRNHGNTAMTKIQEKIPKATKRSKTE